MLEAMRIELPGRTVVSAGILACTHLLEDESGQDLIEYALVACLVGLAAVASMKNLGSKVASVFTSISTSVTGSI